MIFFLVLKLNLTLRENQFKHETKKMEKKKKLLDF